MRKPGALITIVAAAGLAACGAQPAAVPDVSKTASPKGERTFTQPSRDVTFTYPANWALVHTAPPAVATIASGGASATVWAYTSVSGVTDLATARAAQARLLASLERRDPRFRVEAARVTTAAGSPAVEITGKTAIADRPVKLRSVHIYRGAGEYVFDAFADPAVFDRANREVFTPMLESLRLGGRAGAVAPPPSSGAPSPPATPAP